MDKNYTVSLHYKNEYIFLLNNKILISKQNFLIGLV